MGKEGDSTRRNLAQHFTPPDVADLVWRLAAGFGGCQSGDGKVIDPSAGEGALLDAARRAGVRGGRLCGIELDDDLAARARAAGLAVRTGDGLLPECDARSEGVCDAVVGNPPFGRCGKVLSDAQLSGLIAGGGYAIWRDPQKGSQRQRESRLRGAAVEHLFVERALQLVRPGGVVVLVLPQGLFSNTRTQPARDWIAERAEVLAVVALPASAFRGPGLNATAAVLVLRRPVGRIRAGNTVMAAPEPEAGRKRADLAKLASYVLELHGGGASRSRAVIVPTRELPGSRWDVGFWLDNPSQELARCPHPLHRLGDHIEFLTYGPIVTGQRPQHVAGGVRVIGQGDFDELGFRPEPGVCVLAGSIFDPPRSRVARGDLLLPRSGAGSLGRNRMAVYDSEEPANIGCFVDLIRLVDLNPYYVWMYLRTGTGWSQIRRLINGVGVPNISFAEIRSIQVPWVDPDLQNGVEARYRAEVQPLLSRARGTGGDDRAAAALRRLTEAVASL